MVSGSGTLSTDWVEDHDKSGRSEILTPAAALTRINIPSDEHGSWSEGLVHAARGGKELVGLRPAIYPDLGRRTPEHLHL